MYKYAFAAMLAATVATPALAQDTAPDAAPFTGPRVEAIVGYDKLRVDDAGGRDGVVYGGQIGYDAQVGGVVLGIEGEVTDSTAKVRESNFLAVGDSLRINAGRDLSASVRAGVLVSPVAMIYAKGGYTNQRITGSYSGAGGTVTSSDNSEGWRLGAGVEYNLGTRTYLKGEYRYSHYSELIERHQALAGVGIRF